MQLQLGGLQIGGRSCNWGVRVHFGDAIAFWGAAGILLMRLHFGGRQQQAGGCNCNLGMQLRSGGCDCKPRGATASWGVCDCTLKMQLHFGNAIAFCWCNCLLGVQWETWQQRRGSPPPQHPWVAPGDGSSCCHPQSPPGTRMSLHAALTSR